jgi:epoxyqueuosine reductase
MKALIAERALELGFDACHFTTADPPQSARHFQEWLEARRHGDMDYLRRNAPKRVDPKQVLPGAQSIICLAASYEGFGDHEPAKRLASCLVSSSGSVIEPSVELSRHPPPATRHSQPIGIIARYARFRDYHEVLGERLKLLTECVNRLGADGTRSFWYVDTGPLLERDLAQRAGLGFVGKHTNLISRRLGNWIFLAEIITTVRFEPDAPEKNRCGTCTRCLDACPTRAITGPFQLDARRCISYLTIELKGPIPMELRPAIGNRIYGCDDCLAVCPWNKFARAGKLMQDQARPDLDQPDLIELLSLDDAGFKRRFAATPIARTKRRGLLRNVCVALGNVGDTTVLPSLHRAASDTEPLVAEHARWAMQQIEKRERSKAPRGSAAL